MPFSRVIEVESATKKIVWEYREKRASDFFSPRISNAQRLPTEQHDDLQKSLGGSFLGHTRSLLRKYHDKNFNLRLIGHRATDHPGTDFKCHLSGTCRRRIEQRWPWHAFGNMAPA